MYFLKDGVRLYTHQEVALELLRLNKGFALFMEQGTGKTLPTILDTCERLKRNEIKNALIVSPKPVMNAWYRDIDLLTPEGKELILNSATIINYESVWRGKYDQVWDCIILDESHKIKNRTTVSGRWLLKASLKAKVRRILTGTPIGNGRLEDMWSQLAFIDPIKPTGRQKYIYSRDFGTWSNFINNFCILDKYYNPAKYVNISSFQRIVDRRSYRVTKEEALDLPEKLPDQYYEVELQPKHRKDYQHLKKHSVLETDQVDIMVANPLAKLLYLREMASGWVKDEHGNVQTYTGGKARALEEYLDNNYAKLVIFFNFRETRNQIEEVLQKLKRQYVVLDGEAKNKGIWKVFQTDPNCQIILCQYQSASQGIDLYQANTTIYYEPTLSSNEMEQSRDRTHRIGQKKPCTYICFTTLGTVEQAIYRALANHQDFTEKLFTEWLESHRRSYSK